MLAMWAASRSVMLVGDGCCGKSYLQIVFAKEYYPSFYRTTSFEECYMRDVKVDGKKVELSMRDISGQEEYCRLRYLSYPGIDAIAICFSVDKPWSLENVESLWVPEVAHFCPGVPLLLVANKMDLRADPFEIKRLAREKLRPVSLKQGREVADRIGARGYYECSAKHNEGVVEVFENLARIALTYNGARSTGLANKLKSVFRQPGKNR